MDVKMMQERLQSIKNETGQLVSHPRPVDRPSKFKITSGSASYSVKFKFGAKIGLIWAMPAQIWDVHMSNVRMSNADEGPAGGGIKQLVPKIQDHLSHLKKTKRSSIVKSSRKC